MVTFAGYSMENVRQWRCLSTDIVTDKNGKILTNDQNVNKQFRNGDEVSLINKVGIYQFDQENATLCIYV